jgi:hypothetical protein
MPRAGTTAGKPAEASMLQILFGYLEPAAVHSAARLDLADVLGDSVMTAAELAEKTGALPSKMRRLMRFLVGRGVFQRVEDSADGEAQFANNELSSTLRKDAPNTLWGMAMHTADTYGSWMSIQESMTQDIPAWDLQFSEVCQPYI